MLRISRLVARYHSREPVLRDVDLEVPDHGVVALLGSNGAGKSTLMRCVSGTMAMHGGAVTSGSITFEGHRIEGRDAARIARLGLAQVPEGRHVFSGLTVKENLDAGAFTRGRRGDRERLRAEMFELFPRLAERRAQTAGTLSGGEQQMLAIARALMSQPRMLLLDEPSLGLAPQLVEVIGDTVRRIGDSGVPVLLVEQNAVMALDLAVTAYVLDLGRVILSGAAGELAKTDQVQRLYLGEGAAQEHGDHSDDEPAPVPALARWSA